MDSPPVEASGVADDGVEEGDSAAAAAAGD